MKNNKRHRDKIYRVVRKINNISKNYYPENAEEKYQQIITFLSKVIKDRLKK